MRKRLKSRKKRDGNKNQEKKNAFFILTIKILKSILITAPILDAGLDFFSV